MKKLLGVFISVIAISGTGYADAKDKQDIANLKKIVAILHAKIADQKTEIIRNRQDIESILKTISLPISCKAIKENFPHSEDGYYKIFPTREFKNPLRVYCDMTTDGGGWTRLAQFKEDNIDISATTYLDGYNEDKVNDTDSYALKCQRFKDSFPGITMRLEMGEVKDYFKPIDGDLCNMLKGYQNHKWSSSFSGTYKIPDFYQGHLGGSAQDWPKYRDKDTGDPDDNRAYLSFWGGNHENSGCCHNEKTAPAHQRWKKTFTLYFK